MENKNTFGKNLRALREGAGIGQVKLALDLGVSKGIISLWENEKREPTMSYLIALAKYFDVSIDREILTYIMINISLSYSPYT